MLCSLRRLRLLAILATVSVYPYSIQAADEVAEAVPTATASEGNPKATGTPVDRVNPKIRPLNVTVELSTGNSISGTLIEVDVLLIKTAFGEASVPLAEIAGIRFPQGEDVSTSVVMLNGDSITGATDVKLVTVDTDWGQAKINGSAIRSILLIPNLSWSSSSGISGKRWTLQESKPQPNSNTPGTTGTTSLNRPGISGSSSTGNLTPGSSSSSGVQGTSTGSNFSGSSGTSSNFSGQSGSSSSGQPSSGSGSVTFPRPGTNFPN